MSLPTGVNPTTVDRSKPYIDVKTTTVNGVLKQIITDYFLPNTVGGVNGFYGNVLQVIEEPSRFENGSGFSLLTSAGWLQRTLGQVFSSGQMEKRYKVRVPDIDYNKSNPFSVSDKKINACNEQQKNRLLEFYNEFTLSPDANTSPVVGDIVFVTYGNLETRRDGVILYRVGPVPTGYDIANSALGGILARFAGLPGGLLGSDVPTLPPIGAPTELQGTNVTLPVNAAIRGTPLNPNPNLYAQVIDQFRVKTNLRYKIRDSDGDGDKDTFCNILVYDVVRAMGILGGLHWVTKDGLPIPDKDHDLPYKNKLDNGYKELNGRGTYEFLRGDKAKSIGWREVTPIEAQVAANMGFCVISGGHIHVTVIRPGIPRIFKKQDSNYFDDPKCSSAGGNNVEDVFNSQSFGYLDDVTYHVYISPQAGNGFYEKKREELKSIYLPLEQKITQINSAADKEADQQKKYELKKEAYDLTLKARAYGSLLARPTTPIAPNRPAVANKPRPSSASKA